MAETPQNPGEPRKMTLDDVIDRAQSKAELAALADKYPKARAHLDVQARLDESLARLFAAPEIRLKAKAEPNVDRSASRRWRPWAAAAAILMASFGVWWFALRAAGPDVLTPEYHKLVAAGFKPEEICTTDAEFVQWCKIYMKQAIYPKAHPEGMVYVGWSKANVISKISGILLVKVSGEPVIVVMERRDRQTVSPGPTVDPDLHIFSKRIGDVMLYEVSPKAEAVVLPTLSATKG